MAEDLNMSLFEDNDVELNIEGYSDEEDLEQEENTGDEGNQIDNAGEPNPEENNEEENISEDDQEDDPERVAEEEDEDEGGEDDSPNLYSSLATILHEEGLLPSLDLQNSKVESVDDITEAIRGEISTNVKNQLIQALGEDGYEAVTSGIPLEQLAEHRQAQLTLDSINEESLDEDLELSRKVIYQDYINQGISAERAGKLLKRISAAGEDVLKEDARESLTNLKAFEQERIKQQTEENRRLAAEQAKQQEQLETNLKNTIYNSDELLKGHKLNKAIKDRVFESMTTNVGEGNQFETKLIQDRKNNPVDFDAKLYYLYEVTNGFKDLDTFLKSSSTSATKNLEKSIRTSKRFDNSNPAFTQDPESYLGNGEEIVFD